MFRSLLALTLLTAGPALAQEEDGAPSEPPKTVGTQVELIPGVGVNAGRDVAVDGVAISLVGDAASVKGVDAALAATWVTQDVDGVQAAMGVAVTGGSMNGVQGAGLVAVANEVHGAQLAGVAGAARSGFEGVQAATFGAMALGESAGLQLSSLNIVEELDGAQVGLLNVAHHVRGVQLGLVNFAHESDVSIGILSIVGNGILTADAWTSESAILNLGGRIGSKYFYTVGGLGLVQLGDDWWTFGVGWGGRIPAGAAHFDLDATAWGVAEGFRLAPGAHGKLRLSMGLPVGHAVPFVGVSANLWVGDGSVTPRAFGVPASRRPDSLAVAWAGLHAGMQFGRTGR